MILIRLDLLSMSYRFMRLMLFFDLPVESESQRRDYRYFIKNLKKNGFYMMQESVYVKLGIDLQSINSSLEKIKTFLPKDGDVMVLSITEKQFSNINVLLGNNTTDVINSDERVIEL